MAHGDLHSAPLQLGHPPQIGLELLLCADRVPQVGEVGERACHPDPGRVLPPLLQQSVQLRPGRQTVPVQPGLHLDLYLHQPSLGPAQLRQQRQQARPPHSQRQPQLHRRGQQPHRHAPQHQNVLGHPGPPEGRTLRHLGHRHSPDLRDGRQGGPHFLLAQTIGVPLQDRDQLGPVQLLQNGLRIAPQLAHIDV